MLSGRCPESLAATGEVCVTAGGTLVMINRFCTVLYRMKTDTCEDDVALNCAAPNILPVLRKSPGEDVQRNIPSATFGNHMKNAG